MKNIIKYILVTSSVGLLCGCGHSIVRTDRGSGLHLRIPNPFQQGDSFVDFKLGNIDTTMAVIRGNTTFDSTSAKGGSLTGTGGISERVVVSTNPQLNEGYVAEVLTSPNVDPETKKEVAKYLTMASAPKVSDAKSITIGAAAGSGKNSAEITPEKTGIDNIVDKTANVVTDVTPHIAKATENTISNISNDVAETTQHSVDVIGDVTEGLGNAILHHIILSFIIAIVLTIGLIFAIEWIVKKRKEHKEESKTVENTSENTSETTSENITNNQE